MSDKVQTSWINSDGFGTIPKKIMNDTNLTIESKAIYAYFSSYAGSGDTAFPSINLVCGKLGVSKDRFYKHRKILEQQGYLSIKHRFDGAKNQNNIYTLNQFPAKDDLPCFKERQNEERQNEERQNKETISNSSIINSSIKNSDKENNNSETGFSLIYKFWEENGFGIMQPITIQKMQRWLADFNDNHEMILKALEVTVEQGPEKCNFGYVNKILQNWTNRKFETVEQVEAAEQQRNQTKQPKNSQSNKPDIIPDWLEKQIAEEQEQTSGVVKPVIVKNKTEIKTDPAMLERIAQFRKELKGSEQG